MNLKDPTNYVDIHKENQVSEAIYMLIEQVLVGGSLVTPLHALRAAVKDKEQELMYAEDEPIPEADELGMAKQHLEDAA